MKAADCPLCQDDGGRLVVRRPNWRVVHAAEAGFPAFYRVVWNEHRAEFTDLSEAERAECMTAVAAVEEVLRRELKPGKINLAALGNLVPHLHWHVVARFEWDSHFPAPVWSSASRPPPAASVARIQGRLAVVEEQMRQRLG